MPNWCSSYYKFTGDQKELENLSGVINAACSDNFKSFSGFGSAWLGNIIALYGYDPLDEKASWECRGDINYSELFGNELQLSIETAWAPTSMFDRIIEEFYPNLSCVFTAVEPGCEIYVTTDPDMIDKYEIDMMWKDGTEIRECGDYHDIKHVVDKWFGREFKDMEDLQNYIHENIEDLEDVNDGEEVPYFNINAYEYIG